MRNRRREILRYTLLRLAAVYWILWAAPLVLMQVSRLTGIPSLAPSYWRFWNPATHWVGSTLYGFAEPAVWRDSGGSDLPFYWSLTVVELAVAVGASIAWTVAARGRPSPRLASALHTGLRLLLAVILVEYGAAKVVNTQFPSPGFEVLLTPLGDIRPDLLLWAFMGASPGYTLFAGLLELLPGCLLFFRASATIGALLAMGALANVLALNMGYDVPVKLQLLHLLVASAAVAAPGVATGAAAYRSARGGVQRTLWPRVTLSVALILIVGRSLQLNWMGRRTHGELAPHAPLAGAYRVADLTIAGRTIGPEWRWSTLIVPPHARRALLQLPDGRVFRRRMTSDTASHTVILGPLGEQQATDTFVDTLHYRLSSAGVRLTGTVAHVPFTARLTRLTKEELPLLKQRRRWVSDR